MKTKHILCCCLFLLLACGKKDKAGPEEEISGDIRQVKETNNGVTYKVFTNIHVTAFKGILVMGSGSNEKNPLPGSLDNATENDICKKAAQNGYVAAIVQYRKTPGSATEDDWNTSALMIGEDYDKCIVAIADKYKISKNRAVVGGYSYASNILFTCISAYNTLSYCKGVLAACGGSGEWNAKRFKIPIYSINCNGDSEGPYYGKSLYDQIPAGSAVKARSEGVTDASCNGHCQGNWTDRMYTKMVSWLQ